MYKWIDHIVVRVKDIEEGLRDYEGKMGLKRREDPKEIPELGMKRAILPLGDDGRFIELCDDLFDAQALEDIHDEVSCVGR